MTTNSFQTLLHAAILIANIYCTSIILMSYGSQKPPKSKRVGDAFWRFTFDWLTLLSTLLHVATWAMEENYSEIQNFSVLTRWGIATALMLVWVRLRNRPSDKTTFLS